MPRSETMSLVAETNMIREIILLANKANFSKERCSQMFREISEGVEDALVQAEMADQSTAGGALKGLFTRALGQDVGPTDALAIQIAEFFGVSRKYKNSWVKWFDEELKHAYLPNVAEDPMVPENTSVAGAAARASVAKTLKDTLSCSSHSADEAHPANFPDTNNPDFEKKKKPGRFRRLLSVPFNAIRANQNLNFIKAPIFWLVGKVIGGKDFGPSLVKESIRIGVILGTKIKAIIAWKNALVWGSSLLFSAAVVYKTVIVYDGDAPDGDGGTFKARIMKFNYFGLTPLRVILPVNRTVFVEYFLKLIYLWQVHHIANKALIFLISCIKAFGGGAG